MGLSPTPLSSTTPWLLPNGWYQVSAIILDPSSSACQVAPWRASASYFTPERRRFPTPGPTHWSQAERRPGSNSPGPLGSVFQVENSGVISGLQMRPTLSTPPPPLPCRKAHHRVRRRERSARKHWSPVGELLALPAEGVGPSPVISTSSIPCKSSSGLPPPSKTFYSLLEVTGGLTTSLLICYLQNAPHHNTGKEISFFS